VGHPKDRRSSFAAAVVFLATLATQTLAADQPTSPAPSLSTADWRADIGFARTEMPRRHANLFHALTREQYDASFDRLEAGLDHLSEHEVVVRLAEIVASVGDGHSRLTLPMDPAAGFFSGHTGTSAPHVATFRHLPLRMLRTGEGYVVTETDAPLAVLLGSQVVETDGRRIGEADAGAASRGARR